MNVRIGVIGCGAISTRAHLPGFSPVNSRGADLAAAPYRFGGCDNTELVAVADIDIGGVVDVDGDGTLKVVHDGDVPCGKGVAGFGKTHIIKRIVSPDMVSLDRC